MPLTRCLWLTVMLLMRGSVGEMAGEMQPFDSPPHLPQVFRYPSINSQFSLEADPDDATGEPGSSSHGKSPLPGNERKNDPDEGMSFPVRADVFPSSGKKSRMEEVAVEELGVNRRAFNPWGGKKRYFNPWGGKRVRDMDPAFHKRPGFQPWGGKRSEKRAFNPWGGKRGSSQWSRDDLSKAFDKEREFNEKKRNLLRNP